MRTFRTVSLALMFAALLAFPPLFAATFLASALWLIVRKPHTENTNEAITYAALGIVALAAAIWFALAYDAHTTPHDYYRIEHLRDELRQTIPPSVDDIPAPIYSVPADRTL